MAEVMEDNGFRAAMVDVDREKLLAMVVSALNDVLGATVGRREAEGFVSLVGMAVAEQVLARYRAVADASKLDLDATLQALLDWTSRLGGEFRILERADTRVVLINERCPFAGLTGDLGGLCRITSYVFGHMVAESQIHGRVTLADTIARGSSGCHIVIDLEPDVVESGPRSYDARAGR